MGEARCKTDKWIMDAVNNIIISIMVVFAICGGIDYIFGSRLGLGSRFEEGIQTMGTMTLSMTGLLVLAPAIAEFLDPLIGPVFSYAGADPAMFAGIFFGLDMGAAPLASQLAEDPQAAVLGGMITSSMLGATVVFTIPVGLGIIKREDRTYFAKGILTGLTTIPVGVIAGGIAAGLDLRMIIMNTIPVAFISLVIIIGMWRSEYIMTAVFVWFGRAVVAVSIFGLLTGMLDYMLDVELIHDTQPLPEVFVIVGNVALMLAGAFPMVSVITKICRRPLQKFGKCLGINEVSSAGMLVSLANSIPMLSTVSDMDRRGKIMNVAFSVSAAYVFGDHLGFVAGYMPDVMVPVIIAKLTAGVTAAAVAYYFNSPARLKNRK